MSFDLQAFLAHRLGHSHALGIVFREQGPDRAALTLPWRAELTGPDGEIAPGAVLALMDMACSSAVWCRRGVAGRQVTLDLRLDRLRAPRPGQAMVGRGQCLHIANSIAFVRGAVDDGDSGDPFALVAGSFMLLDGAA